jgi:hypothetical protein
MVFGWPGFLEDKVLVASYIVAAVAMLVTIFYLFLRLRAYVTTTHMLIVALLLIYGPASLIYALTSGRPRSPLSGGLANLASQTRPCSSPTVGPTSPMQGSSSTPLSWGRSVAALTWHFSPMANPRLAWRSCARPSGAC